MKTNKLPSAEFLHERFRYDDETGELFYRYKVSNNIDLEDPAGSYFDDKKRGKSYRQVKIDGKFYRNHRIIFKMFNPDWDGNGVIDHKDNKEGIQNNRIENLRLSTPTQNNMNSKLPRNNTSGYKGVVFRNDREKWQAFTRLANRFKHLGYYEDKKQAALVRDLAAVEHHKEFANLNFPQLEGIYKSLLSYQSKNPDVTVSVG